MAILKYNPANTAYPIDAALTDTQSVAVGVTAAAGGGQTNAVLLTKTFNQVDTVATAADSVKLPLGDVGLSVTIVNTSANSLQVFGSGTDTINAVATATGVAQATGKAATYYCATAAPAAKWWRVLSA